MVNSDLLGPIPNLDKDRVASKISKNKENKSLANLEGIFEMKGTELFYNDEELAMDRVPVNCKFRVKQISTFCQTDIFSDRHFMTLLRAYEGKICKDASNTNRNHNQDGKEKITVLQKTKALLQS